MTQCAERCASRRHQAAKRQSALCGERNLEKSLSIDFSERDPNSRVLDCGEPTVGGCKGVNFLFAFELISFVSRPDKGQIMFKHRESLLVTKTFFNAFFERVQATILVLFIENTN